MDKIEVSVLNNTHCDQTPGEMMVFLGRLTQRGHNINNMRDLKNLYLRPASDEIKNQMALTKHGTIKRFSPITVAIVGASRRFLGQARTHQVGMNYVSASLQYSDYSNKARFVVPYAMTKFDKDNPVQPGGLSLTDSYLSSCNIMMDKYKMYAEATDNDTAGYAAPQGLRNILIMQGSHQAWSHFISLRGCNRNTVETQYVTMLIWYALLRTCDGESLFATTGPDCLFRQGCQEGKFSCGEPFEWPRGTQRMNADTIEEIIEAKWPLLKRR